MRFINLVKTHSSLLGVRSNNGKAKSYYQNHENFLETAQAKEKHQGRKA